MQAELDRAHVFEASDSDASRVEKYQHALSLRVGVFATLSAIAFLISYALLHALHVAKLEPACVRALSAIPLFATFSASIPPALVCGALLTPLALASRAFSRRLPALLALATGVFVLEILIFP